MFHLEIVEGEWLTDNRLADGSSACVVTQQLVDKLKWTQTLGRKIFMRGNNFTVTGVLSGIKHKIFFGF